MGGKHSKQKCKDEHEGVKYYEEFWELQVVWNAMNL